MGYKLDQRKTKRKNKMQDIQSGISRSMSLPNSLVTRILQDPAAEKEADRLSQGVTSSTPDEIVREMGGRLGADFSDVQFHSDALSMNRSNALGARAWAQGRDVYFGNGGFDPKIAAHELVHTVQQGAVHGDTMQTAPNGSVQLFRGEDDNAIHRRIVPANADNLALMTEQKNSSQYGSQVFSDLKKAVKTLAQKSGSRIRAVNEDNGISFIANLGERDYSGKEILRDIATRTVINKDEMYDRTDEYEGFLDFMKTRTDKVGLEAASLQAGILNGQPKYNHNNAENNNKRAYEMTAAELSNDTFNPTHDAEIASVLEKIDAAQNETDAYHAFLGYTQNKEYTQQEINNSRMVVNFARQPITKIANDQGILTEVDPSVAEKQDTTNAAIMTKIRNANTKIAQSKEKGRKAQPGSQEYEAARQEYLAAKQELDAAHKEKNDNYKKIDITHKMGATVNVPLLKAKLKNMVRQIRDYPELKHKIGGLNIQWNQSLGAYRENTSETVMSVHTSAGASEKATINYDAYIDRDSPEAQQQRDKTNNKLAKSIGNLNKVGNHELGHVLESTLNEDEEDQTKGRTSNDILQSVLPKVMDPAEQAQVNYNQQDGQNSHGKNIYQGQIDTTSPIFKTKKMSSSYGQSMPKEWFAEAFHDVYTKGADAKPTSKEIVKEYERRQTAKQKGNFQKKQRGFFTNIGRKISKWFNFGRRHGEPEPAPQNAAANQLPAGQNAGQVPEQIGQEVIQNQQPDEIQQNNENVFDQDLIVERPKKKKIRKKRK